MVGARNELDLPVRSISTYEFVLYPFQAKDDCLYAMLMAPNRIHFAVSTSKHLTINYYG